MPSPALLYYNSFDRGSCEIPEVPPGLNGGHVSRTSWCPTSTAARIFLGGSNSRGAQFNNQDPYRMTYQRSANIVLGNTWTISVWVKTNTCSNNQIPLYFQNRQGNIIWMIDHHSRARISNNHAGGGHYGGSRCNAWNNQWKHHVYQDTGSRFRAGVNGDPVPLSTNNRNSGVTLEGAWLRCIGSQPSWGTNGLGGWLDEMVIWNRVLSTDEVAAMYALRQSSTRYATNL